MAYSKYSDERAEAEGGIPEHKLHLLPARKYDPAAGGDDGEGGIYSHLHESCTGDWSWRPHRHRDPGIIYDAEERGLGHLRPDRFLLRYMELEDQMLTFFGVPPSGAELYRGAHA